mgnify:FL=1
MDRKDILKVMENIYTSQEAAEYLGMSYETFCQIVQSQQIQPIKQSHTVMLFLKSDLDDYYKMKHSQESFNINQVSVRDAILYYTIQQYFDNSDKKTLAFIQQIKQFYHFDFHAGLKINIPFLASQFHITEQEFYNSYLQIKKAFTQLPANTHIIKKGEDKYPQQLADTKEAPLFLFVNGQVNLLYQKSICVVGSRKASPYAIEQTKQLVKALVDDGFVVNAGLAKGIDTVVHQTVLQNKGQTIAVIGTSLHEYYPKENQTLQFTIEKEGLVVSQYPPCQHVNRWNFPKRNATMSGLSIGTVIMEASENSGTLKQADYALRQGRYVFIPQYIVDDSSLQWPQKYIDKGAYVFETYDDMMKIIQHQKQEEF